MKVLWHIHAYPPVHNAGAEWMAHDINRFLRERHEVRVLTSWSGEFEGIPVIADGNPVVMNEQYRWADVVFSHLGRSGIAYNKTKALRKPFLFVSHNTHPYTFCRVSTHHTQHVHVVHNAEWSRATLMYQRPGVVVYPPVYWNRWRKSKGDRIALVNLNSNKGGAILEQIALRMPEHKFLAVEGMYGKQHTRYPDNVEWVPNTPDMQAVYDRCRIVLMPSDYESWGRVGVEAMSCGIPVIAHPTPGLKESLGHAGIFVDRSNVAGYVDAIRNLDDRKAYLSAREKALARAKELDPIPQLEALEAYLHDLHRKG